MKIALFITSLKGNTGFGGHYRSTLTYYENLLSHKHAVNLLHYNKLSKSILDGKVENKLQNIKGLFPMLSVCEALFKAEKTEVVISFSNDLYSDSLRFLCLKLGILYVAVIPGGKSRSIPLFLTNCIYFSAENMANKRDYTKNKFHLTNRVQAFECDPALIDNFTKDYPKRALNIIRVSRIAPVYLATFIATIKLHKFLQSKGYDVQTHLIGIIEDEHSYGQLKEAITGLDNIYIITTPQYTKEVKLLLDYYDVAIGIGRGFWEAASKKLITLGFSTQSELPIIVDNSNYQELRTFNFSPRVKADARYSIEHHLNFFDDKKDAEAYINNLYEKYTTDYSAPSITPKLLSIISESEKERWNLISISLITDIMSNLSRYIYKDIFKN